MRFCVCVHNFCRSERVFFLRLVSPAPKTKKTSIAKRFPCAYKCVAMGKLVLRVYCITPTIRSFVFMYLYLFSFIYYLFYFEYLFFPLSLFCPTPALAFDSRIARFPIRYAASSPPQEFRLLAEKISRSNHF